MIIAIDLCKNSGTLKALYIVKIFFNIILYLLPIIVIITTMSKLFKAVTSGKKEDLNDVIKPFVSKIIASFVVMLLPTLFNYLFTELANQDVSFATCMENATLEKIKAYEEAERQERLAEKETEDKDLSNKTKERTDKEKAENNQNQKERESQQQQQQQQQGDQNGSQDTQTQSSTGQGEILSTGTSGTYFAPLQNVEYKITGASETGGCPNNGAVYHDARVKVGTPIYAAFDGTVEYAQSLCGNVLYSYGNQARLTDPNTGTLIVYAHLSAFQGVDTPGVTNCPKTGGSNGPCPSTSCSSGVKRKTVTTKSVKRGELIGYTGDTGNSVSPHLHVEMKENGGKVCVTDPYAAFGMR